MCRLYHKHYEMIMYIVSGCEMLCGTKYLYRHEKIGAYLHWLILRDNRFKVCVSWLHHAPLSTTAKGKVTIYWDTPLLTDKIMKSNKPDIMIWNTMEQTAQLIDVTAQHYYNAVSATANKITKYKDMQIEIKKFWNLKIVAIVPFVIGALGSACNSITTHLVAISDDALERIVQKTALLGISHILRNFLS